MALITPLGRSQELRKVLSASGRFVCSAHGPRVWGFTAAQKELYWRGEKRASSAGKQVAGSGAGVPSSLGRLDRACHLGSEAWTRGSLGALGLGSPPRGALGRSVFIGAQLTCGSENGVLGGTQLGFLTFLPSLVFWN